MAQTLLIGLGGTGSRVVNNVVKELHLNKKAINDGDICCAVMDTNVNDNESIEDSNTGVPVIPTSKVQKIKGYFQEYAHLHMEKWCPQSPAFLEQSLIDGASELRVKSRIAFMDCLESGVTEKLELMINKVLKNNSGSKIRIMIVSSLSGGTGSGMFIQVALWLRKFLSQSQITIRGIFMLPDVFISTIKDIKDNKTTTVRHYCNAYAAIRELNTITKIMKGNSVDLPEKIELGDLFDSLVDKDSGKPVYDFAFFVDDKDENGVRLESISEYEKMVAQLVYMQLYAPMKDDMYSEEDNAFLSFVENEEPLYGSCGTAKAVYPRTSVKLYCALRAAQDAISGGWKKIDDEIAALKAEKKQLENDGIFSNETFDPRDYYIKVYEEKTSVKAGETGMDRFFLSIAKDAKNEVTSKAGDKIIVTYSDKHTDFLKLLNDRIDVAVTRHSTMDEFALDAEEFVAADHTKQELLDKIKDDEGGMSEALDGFDKKAEEYADSIVNAVFPYSMGDVNAKNRHSIYGLLSKENTQGTWDFIHPVAARYVLYKLSDSIDRSLKKIALKDSRDEALAGGDIGSTFDNKATANVTEASAEELLNSKKWYQPEGAFLDDYENRYAQFIATKIELCEKYQKECLQVYVYRKLGDRLKALIDHVEAFFAKLNDVQTKLQEDITANIDKTGGIVGKTMFVFGDRDAKESVYQSLDLNIDSSAEIYRNVIDSIYGSVCAKMRPSNPLNLKYKDIGIADAFIISVVNAFRNKIDTDKNNSERVNLDIYTALCRECDAITARKAEEKRRRASEEGSTGSRIGALSNVDLEAGEIIASDNPAHRYKEALVACKEKLHRMAAPFLTYETEVSKNALGTVTTRPKTFWGFSPEVVTACPYIDSVLKINADIQADDAYPKNELYCYRAIYGLEATYVPKFNELKGGAYYTCYDFVVSNMVKDADGKSGDRAYVRTPHLDMNWHRILPYITAEKQKTEELAFFHGFWLAVAYGIIKTDKKGRLYIKRSVDGGHGIFIDEDVPVMHKKHHLTKTDVVMLIETLKVDKVFTGYDIPKLEAKFIAELEGMVTYIGTGVLKGLTRKNEDLNPISIVSRYNEAPGHNKSVSAMLIGGLEKIADEMAGRYNLERSEKQQEEAKYRICKRIYDSSKRTKGKSNIFKRWEEAFGQIKNLDEDTEN